MEKSLVSSRLGSSLAINDGSDLENLLRVGDVAIGHIQLLINSCPSSFYWGRHSWHNPDGRSW